MKAILINPHERTVHEIEYGGDYRQIAAMLECELFTTVRLTKTETLFLDDEGWINPDTGDMGVRTGQAYFWLDGYPQLLAGRGLIIGNTADGESCATRLTATLIAQHVQWGTTPEAFVPPKPQFFSL